jgi:hypothetical protein
MQFRALGGRREGEGEDVVVFVCERCVGCCVEAVECQTVRADVGYVSSTRTCIGEMRPVLPC